MLFIAQVFQRSRAMSNRLNSIVCLLSKKPTYEFFFVAKCAVSISMSEGDRWIKYKSTPQNSKSGQQFTFKSREWIARVNAMLHDWWRYDACNACDKCFVRRHNVWLKQSFDIEAAKCGSPMVVAIRFVQTLFCLDEWLVINNIGKHRYISMYHAVSIFGVIPPRTSRSEPSIRRRYILTEIWRRPRCPSVQYYELPSDSRHYVGCSLLNFVLYALIVIALYRWSVRFLRKAFLYFLSRLASITFVSQNCNPKIYTSFSTK